MALRIRCNACSHEMVVPDHAAGRAVRCAGCEQWIAVPMPADERAPAPDVSIKCPHCGYGNAPGTGECRKCGTDLESGRRPSLGKRLRLVSFRAWALSAATVAAVLLLSFVGYHLVANYRRVQPTPVSTASQPEPGSATALGSEPADALLAAADLDSLVSAYSELQRLGAEAAPAVARALADNLDNPADTPLRDRGRLLAVRFLAEHAHRHSGRRADWLATLRRCEKLPALRHEAVRTRAMLGDLEVAPELAELWRRAQRRCTLFDRVAEIELRDASAGLDLARQHARRHADRLTIAQQRLVTESLSGVLEPLAEGYWESWGWLGQARGEAYATALFEVAQPYRPGRTGRGSEDADEMVEDIRAARRSLEALAREGSAVATAAVGLVLVQCAPQYQSARERVAARLGNLFAECSPPEQQRVTWALTRMLGRSFGECADGDDPWIVGLDEVRAVYVWIGDHDYGVIPDPIPSRRYPKRPVLVSRVVTPERRLEGNLLRAFGEDWRAASAALDEWSEAELGCTPGIEELLNPAQRAPNASALAAAMVIAAESDARHLRSSLELWQEAADQPAWVRGLAHCVLGSFDARDDSWDSDWPSRLENEVFVGLASGRPGWEYFGRVLAAGGESMLRRLESYTPSPISDQWRTQLIRAARKARGSR